MSDEPHTCPTCHGEKKITEAAAAGHPPASRACPTCGGQGVVWRRSVEEAATDDGYAPEDLTNS